MTTKQNDNPIPKEQEAIDVVLAAVCAGFPLTDHDNWTHICVAGGSISKTLFGAYHEDRDRRGPFFSDSCQHQGAWYFSKEWLKEKATERYKENNQTPPLDWIDRGW